MEDGVPPQDQGLGQLCPTPGLKDAQSLGGWREQVLGGVRRNRITGPGRQGGEIDVGRSGFRELVLLDQAPEDAPLRLRLQRRLGHIALVHP